MAGRAASGPPPHRSIEDRIEELARRGRGQQPLGGLLEGREVGYAVQAEQGVISACSARCSAKPRSSRRRNSLRTRQARSWGCVKVLGLLTWLGAGAVSRAAS